MEALTGVSVAALTLYDMCKAVDKTMRIGEIHIVEKNKTIPTCPGERSASRPADIGSESGETQSRRTALTA